MTDRQFTPDEQAFLAETGLKADDLAPLVADAPPLPADTLERIRSRAREKAGLAPAAAAAAPAAATPALPSRRPDRRPRRWLAAAAAALLLVGGTVVLSNPEGALAAIQRLVRLVPGIGLTETDGETWILPEPVSVEQDGVRVTVTGAISNLDGTQVRYRVDWPADEPLDKVEFASARESAFPELRLPDGTVIRRWGGSLAGGTRDMVGQYNFGPLPPGTSEVTLVLPYLSGVAEPVEIPVTLVNAEEAGLAGAHPGNWSEERLGVQVGVPYWTAVDDRIVVSLDTRLPDGTRVIDYRDWIEPHGFVEPVLIDDQGHTYPLIIDEADRSGPWRRAVFQGPLAPDARQLTLTVPYLILADYTAEARLTVPLEQLAEGKPLRLNEELQIGSHRFTVETVTRIDADTFGFTLDLGPEEGGVLLQKVGIRHRMFGGPRAWSAHGENGQFTSMEVDFRSAPRRNLVIVFADPGYRVHGEWQVELPVPAGRSDAE